MFKNIINHQLLEIDLNGTESVKTLWKPHRIRIASYKKRILSYKKCVVSYGNRTVQCHKRIVWFNKRTVSCEKRIVQPVQHVRGV